MLKLRSLEELDGKLTRDILILLEVQITTMRVDHTVIIKILYHYQSFLSIFVLQYIL